MVLSTRQLKSNSYSIARGNRMNSIVSVSAGNTDGLNPVFFARTCSEWTFTPVLSIESTSVLTLPICSSCNLAKALLIMPFFARRLMR
jgi:hypothetical protein